MSLAKMDKYKDFKFLHSPEKFVEFFKGKTFDLCQIYDLTALPDGDICGFAGVFSFDGDKITSLDGDYYSQEMEIWGYEEFEKDGEHVLSVLSENW